MKHWASQILNLFLLVGLLSACTPASTPTVTGSDPSSSPAPEAEQPYQPDYSITQPPAPTASLVLEPVGEVQPIPNGFVYLGDKATLALGFNMDGGGSVGSLLYNGRELVDHTDYGRYFQLSLYDGGDHYGPRGDDPYGDWGWNPLQAGSSAGGGLLIGAKALEYRRADGMVYIKALGKEWGPDNEDSDVIYETWALQRDGYFEIHSRATHTGSDTHTFADQEFPAAYYEWALTHMYGYFGNKPFTGDTIEELNHVAREGEIAGMASCPRMNPTENWAAFGDSDLSGLILLVPPQAYLQPRWNICLLYAQPPVGYISPMASFDVPAGAARDITYYMIPGPVQTGRAIVYDLLPHTTWNFDLDSFEGWQGFSAQDDVENGILSANLTPGSLLTSQPDLNIPGSISPTVTLSARADAEIHLCLHFITTADAQWDAAKSSCTPLTAGDMQTASFDLSQNPAWMDGVVTQLALTASSPALVEIDFMKVESQGQAWEFETDGVLEGWVAWNHLTPLETGAGILSAEGTGDDPYIGSPVFTLDAAQFPIVEFRMAVTAGNNAQVYFLTATSPHFDETKALSFPVTADGKFHTYRLDMTKTGAWKGTITQIRLDPADAVTSVEVDYVRIMDK